MHGEPFSNNATRCSFYIASRFNINMEARQDELQRAMRDLDRKLALPDDKFEKYASDLLERAVKGLRRSR